MKNILRAFATIFSDRYSSVIFFVLLLLTGWLYGYQEIAHYKPQSFHQFRQSDCLSITLNYYHGDLPFHTPAIHNQFADEGNSGYSAGEFPLLYYGVAQLWKIFGYHLWMYRVINTLIMFAGLLCLFRLLGALLKDTVWSMGIALLVLASPIIAFYTCNFLTNTTSFGLVMIAWYCFYLYTRSFRRRYLLLCAILFSFAGLLKVSSLITWVAWMLLFICHELKLPGIRRYGLFRHRWLMVAGIFIVVLPLLGWYRYAQEYNGIHRGTYTYNDLFPIWKMSAERIRQVTRDFFHLMIFQWYHRIALGVFGAMYLFCIISLPATLRRLPLLFFLFFTVQIGCILYMLCWFPFFGNHDYYMIEMMPMWIVLFATFALSVKTLFPRGFRSLPVKIAFAVFVLLNIAFAKLNMDVRYNKFRLRVHHPHPLFSREECGYWEYFYIYHQERGQYYLRMETLLDNLGVGQNEKVLFLPDNSINIPFVLAGRKGNNAYAFSNYQGRDRIEHFRQKGATVLIITDPVLLGEPYMQEYLPKEIGSDGPVHVFGL